MGKNIRQKIEELEEISLHEFAVKSKNTLGRKVFEEEKDIRTAFMIDRDRIIHSKAFRRLKHKTQVFIKNGDHYRTRLTHTLEVNQIAKTIGKALFLNEDLIEAIALGHDIGHCPFAHVGEEVLNEISPYGFKHNENSVRVLTNIEKDYKGLNLTVEVLDGILKHSGFSSKFSPVSDSLEGQVVKYSDKIAYINHDIDDSILYNILKIEEIPRESVEILGKTSSDRINTLVSDLIYTSLSNIDNNQKIISFSDKINKIFIDLRSFMFNNIYLGDTLGKDRSKAKFVIENVYLYFLKNPEKMPKVYFETSKKENLHRGVTDYVSGMTDDYCLKIFSEIYIPKITI